MSEAGKAEAAATRSARAQSIATAKRVLAIEAQALTALSQRVGESFADAVEVILGCSGRLVITGMGKSGQICRKLAATFASTGTSSFFVHAAEAAHGDLGMLARGDVCLGISNSGTTRELVGLLPAFKRLEIPIIAMTGGLDSPLATHADVTLDVSVAEEACPLGLAPTASTTVTLALGDALAVAVLERRGFTSDDFALLHPGGALGRQLVRVADLMHADTEVPCVSPANSVERCIEAITGGSLGVVAVVDDAGALVGAITDGDIRRGVLSHRDLVGRQAAEIMSTSPKTVSASALAAVALAIMEKYAITSLFILEPDTHRPVGIIHLHDLLKAQVA